MTYLTRSYVKWLGLRHFPVIKPGPTAIYITENSVKPEVTPTVGRGVRLNGHLYVEEIGGLSYKKFVQAGPRVVIA